MGNTYKYKNNDMTTGYRLLEGIRTTTRVPLIRQNITFSEHLYQWFQDESKF